MVAVAAAAAVAATPPYCVDDERILHTMYGHRRSMKFMQNSTAAPAFTFHIIIVRGSSLRKVKKKNYRTDNIFQPDTPSSGFLFLPQHVS